jgi:hypothetical protein
VVYEHDYVCGREMAAAIGIPHFGHRYRWCIRLEDVVYDVHNVG